MSDWVIRNDIANINSLARSPPYRAPRPWPDRPDLARRAPGSADRCCCPRPVAATAPRRPFGDRERLADRQRLGVLRGIVGGKILDVLIPERRHLIVHEVILRLPSL